uniref:Uncharacterized protein n=1 Tax=Rhizophora mucronata TaxID=61149 RepID=A0A2P2L779_RHIMU
MAATLSLTFLTQNFPKIPSYQALPRVYNRPLLMINLKNRAHLVPCSAKKKISFVDQILDYIEGGPKLRRWYGAPDLVPKDGPTEDEFSGIFGLAICSIC